VLFTELHSIITSSLTRLPYNLYCVGGDVKHCSLTHSLTHSPVHLPACWASKHDVVT